MFSSSSSNDLEQDKSEVQKNGTLYDSSARILQIYEKHQH